VGPRERTGVLIVRAWTDEHAGLRARIVAADDVRRRNEVAAGIEEICASVREWLETLGSSGAPRAGPIE
jgi:hypothetical protein